MLVFSTTKQQSYIVTFNTFVCTLQEIYSGLAENFLCTNNDQAEHILCTNLAHWLVTLSSWPRVVKHIHA